MLTIKENFLETIRGGSPDRFVKQHEAYANLLGNDPLTRVYNVKCVPGEEYVDAWGVTMRWEEGTPGKFPVHSDDKKVLKDITRWRDVVRAPSVKFAEEDWKHLADHAATIDRNEHLVMLTTLTGVFEQLHYLMGMQDTLTNFYLEPDEMKALINYIAEHKLSYMTQVFERVKVDAFFLCDDWGTAISTFLAPEMMREFFLEPYQRIYGCAKEHGVEVTIHHSDSYAATLVPLMIEMGIDVYQGCMSTNNTPELIEKYGGRISFQGDLDNGKLDTCDWSPELIRTDVERACRSCGKHHFIPCLIAAGPFSTYEGVYECVDQEIDRMSRLVF